ncbi:LANO_0H16116g1_1 [Lachancea nothofagi CBS 11611]|uniref:Anaphase-promoting complex subunit 5 n=1 Tax=Lachancea nothofagi CBS 11611 TaxID=1266666 RepID=A0A1G4KN18_9SACH|nr:LANO_0H16116g1_1 [Lachancea nothofagi CBS 11611]
MNCKQSVVITNTLTPHDISILIVITFYCSQVEQFDQKLLMSLVPPVSPRESLQVPFNNTHETLDSHPVLPPLLLDLVLLLVEHDQRRAAQRLVAALDAITTINGITKLVDTLEAHCIRATYREVSSGSEKNVIKRKLTQTSLLGSYVCHCITKHKLQDFEDSERLWRNLQGYLQQFRQAEEMSTSFQHQQLPKLDPLMSFIFEDNGNGEELESLRELQETGVFSKYADLISIERHVLMMLSRDHLQALLMEETKLMLAGNKRLRERTRLIMDCMSLEDTSRFPSVHILRGIEDLNEQRYDNFLNLLYRYFDYMLGQNSEPNFHLSLLSLASFHAHFNDSEAAVKTFEEAIAVARENKDTKTLNLILMWVFEFIGKYPSLANRFHVTTEQIINYLKTCSGNQSSYVFEMGYRYETLWAMLSTGLVPAILESLFKSSLLALQNTANGVQFSLLAAHNAQVWNYLGSSALRDSYQSLAKERLPTGNYQMVQRQDLMDSGDSNLSHEYLTAMDCPYLTYHEKRILEKLNIDYLSAIGDYDEAMRFVNLKIHECQSESIDSENEQRFKLAKCKIMITCGLEVRCLPILTKVLEHATLTGNSYLLAPSVLLLSKVLLSLGKREECEELLSGTMHHILKFSNPSFQRPVVDLFLASRETMRSC